MFRKVFQISLALMISLSLIGGVGVVAADSPSTIPPVHSSAEKSLPGLATANAASGNSVVSEQLDQHCPSEYFCVYPVR